MIRKNIIRLTFILLAGLISFSMIFAVAANNTVPVTHLTDQSSAITVNDVKPSACSAIVLTAIVYCPTGPGGACDGTDANELVIGSPAYDDIRSGKGDDCIVAGGDDDDIRGEQPDVCIMFRRRPPTHP
jgi:hypothetical protein